MANILINADKSALSSQGLIKSSYLLGKSETFWFTFAKYYTIHKIYPTGKNRWIQGGARDVHPLSQ